DLLRKSRRFPMTNITSYGQKHQNRAGLSGYVAELGAAFLCSQLGVALDPRADHAAYIDHWLKILKADSKAIFQASSLATKAVEYLKGLQM
ncbi:zincin-like metallopeptidase domain-containing protein, partial [Pseudochrobactrum asaccharolyticum]|uniref:zincin-like metallopeptidase domain-containing protein n=2 Tax=Pseudochrobactrum asaccharolyticum TaxID=354351 RepID=UPI001FE0C2DD